MDGRMDERTHNLRALPPPASLVWSVKGVKMRKLGRFLDIPVRYWMVSAT